MNATTDATVIGLDAHVTTCEFAIVDPDGHVRYAKRVPTTARALISALTSIPGSKKIVVLEEGCMSPWLIRTLRPYCDKVVSCDPKRNRWIARDAYKNDQVDAVKLSHLYQGGFIQEVYHTPEVAHERFKQTVLFYHTLVKSQTRLKNKIKACFRQRGIRCTGESVYNPADTTWVSSLGDDHLVKWQITLLRQQLILVADQLGTVTQKLATMSRRYPEIARFRKLPGIGLVHACTIYALIDTPFRFPTKRKLWTYSGLGLTDKGSGGKKMPTHLNKSCNRLLKGTIKRAVESALQARDNAFKAQYQRLIYDKGILPHRATLTVARSMLATIYAMWKHGTAYVDPRHR